MCIRAFNLTLGFVCVMILGALSQDDSRKVIIGGPPPSLTEQLKLHHVELTEAGLVKALQSPNAHVRDLAAARLAEEQDVSAVPAIDEALAKEKVTETRINIAFSLALLGQEKGMQELRKACDDSRLPGYFRARAAVYTQQLGSKACFTASLELLRSDPGSREQILSLLPQYSHPSNDELEDILAATLECLTDESGAVRIQAGMALAALGKPSAIPYLQSAIAREQDEVVRSQMQASLDQLVKKKQR